MESPEGTDRQAVEEPPSAVDHHPLVRWGLNGLDGLCRISAGDDLILMEKLTFADLLEEVSIASRDIATRYVVNELPPSFQYFVYLNMSHDGNPLKSGEEVFPDVASRYGERIGPLAGSAVVDLLWRDGLIPRWIDVAVVQADPKDTYFLLLCCGRYTSDEKLLYYSKRNQGPFGIKGPPTPFSWTEARGRFDINKVDGKWPRFP